MRKLFKEFKEFINKGNVMSLAFGVIIGSAFTPITNALVNNILMPILGVIVGDIDFTELKTVLVEEVVNEAGEVVTAEVAIGWGILIGAIVNFLIIAICIFLCTKLLTSAQNSRKEVREKAKEYRKKLKMVKKGKLDASALEEVPAPVAPAAPAAPVETDVDILKEIRDLLKAQSTDKDNK